MKIKKGDTVLIISGKDRGRTGKVLHVFPKRKSILVEGINLKKKHIRPKKEGEKGQVVKIPKALNVSNVKLICPKCKKPTRVGYKITKSEVKKDSQGNLRQQKSKVKICKRCGQAL